MRDIGIFWAFLAFTGLALLPSPPAAAAECNATGDLCSVTLGDYRVALPEDQGEDSRKRPALLFFHGAGQSGRIVLERSAFMVEAFTKAGFVVLLPDGLQRPNSRFGPGWSFLAERPSQRDELAFAKQMIADAAARFAVDPERVLMSGFSIGGSLTWVLACRDADVAAAYAPVAGGFWDPLPERCDGPIKLLHTHGWTDQTVPLEGRPLRSGEIYQGDIFAGLGIWRAMNGCTLLRPDSFAIENGFWRRIWEKCAPGTALEFALHAEGHMVPIGWAELAIAWFDEVVGRP
jgi:polyhydroxybutyrate depolymerase